MGNNFSTRQIPEEARQFIRSWESLKLEAYLCPAKKWTIGYGHTRRVEKGQKITLETAEIFLEEDLRIAACIIAKYVKVELSDTQFAALLSFVFNLGEGNFATSTLLRLLNLKLYKQVTYQFIRWKMITVVKDGKKVKVPSTGLINRRNAEAALWTKNSAPPEEEKHVEALGTT